MKVTQVLCIVTFHMCIILNQLLEKHFQWKDYCKLQSIYKKRFQFALRRKICLLKMFISELLEEWMLIVGNVKNTENLKKLWKTSSAALLLRSSDYWEAYHFVFIFLLSYPTQPPPRIYCSKDLKMCRRGPVWQGSVSSWRTSWSVSERYSEGGKARFCCGLLSPFGSYPPPRIHRQGVLMGGGSPFSWWGLVKGS